MSDDDSVDHYVTLRLTEVLHQIGQWVAEGDALRTNDRRKWLTVTGTHERSRRKSRRPDCRDTIELSGNGTDYHLLQWVEQGDTGPMLYRETHWEGTPDDLNPYDYPRGGERIETIELGVRYGQSPLTGKWYRVTKWETIGEGKIQSTEKEEVEREQVPPAWIEQTEEMIDDAE